MAGAGTGLTAHEPVPTPMHRALDGESARFLGIAPDDVALEQGRAPKLSRLNPSLRPSNETENRVRLSPWSRPKSASNKKDRPSAATSPGVETLSKPRKSTPPNGASLKVTEALPSTAGSKPMLMSQPETISPAALRTRYHHVDARGTSDRRLLGTRRHAERDRRCRKGDQCHRTSESG